MTVAAIALTTACRGIAALATAFMAPPLQSSNATLDARRSVAEFEVRAMWLFDVRGRFGDVTGQVRFDQAAASVQVEARIDVRGVQMRRASYAEWVKSDEFFDAAHHPQITFLSQPFPIELLQRGGPINGSLSVRGVTRPMQFQLRASEDCDVFDVTGAGCAVVADGSLSRSEFGMTTRRNTLSDKVRLHLRVFAAMNPDD